MTQLALTGPARARSRGHGLDVALLLALFAAGVAIRVAAAGHSGARSLPAALAFAAVLAAAALLARRTGVRATTAATPVRVALLGLAGAVVLVLPVVLRAVVNGPGHPAGAYAPWVFATTVVATAEEWFLRGALFDAVTRWRGADAAVVIGAIAFALLHVPLYGWHVLPLDLAVGLLLGALRLAAGTWAAPAIAHVAADLVGWWFV